MSNDSGINMNHIMSLLLHKITVPENFHARVDAVKEMLEDDVSGLVDSLTDFAVQVASVDFTIETDSEKFTEKLKKWLDNINAGYNGRIPRGIDSLAEEYFKERWKSSSFPVLKIAKWEIVEGIQVPTKMFFVDGGSIYAEDTSEKGVKELLGYEYYLGENNKEKLNKNVIFTRPYGRWFDEYPTPFLIKRGVYHNWSIIKSLKNKESTILDEVIPYMFLVKKGTESLATNNIKTYKQEELTAILQQFKDLVKGMQIGTSTGQTPTRVANFDEELKHLIPDLRTIFEPNLFSQAERNILSGLGFIDVISAISTSRRESILSPKPFIEEIKKGVKDFKGILKEIVAQIIEKNKESHKKYMSENMTFSVVSSPVKGFMTGDFKDRIRQLYDRGAISKQTAVEVIGELEFETEIRRREQESKRGLDYTLYPPLRENKEGVGEDIIMERPIKKETDKNDKEIPDNKKDKIEKKEYDIGRLVGSPYDTIKQLPESVRKKLNLKDQRKWMKIWNSAYSYMLGKTGDKKKSETYAFRVAWSQLKSKGK